MNIHIIRCCLAVLLTLGAAHGALAQPLESKADVIEAPINRGGLTLTITIAPIDAHSNFHYDVHVTVGDRVDQRFRMRNGRPITAKDVRLADLNADGCLDIMVVGGKDHRGEDWYKTLIYDEEENKYHWMHRAGLAVRSEKQALDFVQQYERKLYREMYGRDADLPPLASRDAPHSVVETEASYQFEFRKPFTPTGGGYIKGFSVNKRTGEVSRGAWTLGR